MVIDKGGIFKNNEITLLPCFTLFSPRTGMVLSLAGVSFYRDISFFSLKIQLGKQNVHKIPIAFVSL